MKKKIGIMANRCRCFVCYLGQEKLGDHPKITRRKVRDCDTKMEKEEHQVPHQNHKNFIKLYKNKTTGKKTRVKKNGIL